MAVLNQLKNILKELDNSTSAQHEMAKEIMSLTEAALSNLGDALQLMGVLDCTQDSIVEASNAIEDNKMEGVVSPYFKKLAHAHNATFAAFASLDELSAELHNYAQRERERYLKKTYAETNNGHYECPPGKDIHSFAQDLVELANLEEGIVRGLFNDRSFYVRPEDSMEEIYARINTTS